MEQKRDRLWDFLRSFGGHWFNYMSGFPSVPLAIATLYVESAPAKTLLWLTAIFCVVLSAFLMWRTERREVIHLEKELKKVDRQDLQNMLGGRFLGDTFVYGAEWVLCERYEGAFALERLKNHFDMIRVRAPKNSSVALRFQYLNGREGIGHHAFYILDGNGQETLIDIYQPPNIYLDGQCRFGLKLVCNEAYQIHESASLWVGVDSWTK